VKKKRRLSATDREIVKKMKFLKEMGLLKDLHLFVRVKK
jgi:hypothetical protein